MCMYINHDINNAYRIIEKVAVDILWDIWTTSKIIAQKKIFQPDSDKDEIKTKRKRGIAVG